MISTAFFVDTAPYAGAALCASEQGVMDEHGNALFGPGGIAVLGPTLRAPFLIGYEPNDFMNAAEPYRDT